MEALRERLRQARDGGVSPRRIAREAGVSHTTVYALLGKGEAPETQTPTLDKLWTWVDNPPRQTDAKGAPGGVSNGSGVTMSDREYGRLCGTLEVMERWVGSLGPQVTTFAATLDAVAGSLRGLRGQVDELGQATKGAVGLLAAVGPRGPNGGTTPTGDRVHTHTAAEQQAAIDRVLPPKPDGQQDVG